MCRLDWGQGQQPSPLDPSAKRTGGSALSQREYVQLILMLGFWSQLRVIFTRCMPLHRAVFSFSTRYCRLTRRTCSARALTFYLPQMLYPALALGLGASKLSNLSLLAIFRHAQSLTAVAFTAARLCMPKRLSARSSSTCLQGGCA